MQAGDFAGLAGRDELWRLLTRITLNKSRERARHEAALKRGGPSRTFVVAADGDSGGPLDDVASPLAPPDLLAAMTKECQRLLGVLGDKELEGVALMKLEGYTNDEIAEMLGCTRRTVQRMLALIRRLWGEP